MFIKIFAVIILLTVLYPSAQAINLPPSAKLLPPETVIVVDVPVFDKLNENFKKTDLYKLYKDPLMAPFIEEVKGKWQKVVKELDDNDFLRGLIKEELYPNGRLAFAFVDSKDVGIDSTEPPVTFIGQWGAEITKVKEIVDKSIEKNSVMGGRKLEDINFQGVKIHQVVDENDFHFNYCYIDDCFMGGVSIEAIKFVIAHIKGAASPTLADDSNYNGTLKVIGMQNDITMYLNIAYLIKKAFEEDTEGNIRQTFTNLGVDKIGGLGLGMVVAQTPLEVYKMKMLLKVNGAKTGILKALEPQMGPVNIPRFVPTDSVALGLINIDAKSAFDELIKILSLFNPGVASILYNPMTPPSEDGTPGLTVKADIIDHLSTGVVIVQSLNKPFSKETLPSDYMVAIATSNRTAIEKSLAKLHAQMIAPNDPDAMKELLGHTLYIVKLSRMPFLGGPSHREPMTKRLAEEEMPSEPAPKIPDLAFTVTDTHVILGFQSSVENAVRTLKASQSLKDQRWLNQAKASLPSKVGLASFENSRAAMEFLWWLLTDSVKNPVGAGMSAPTASYLIDNTELDFSLLPEYDKIKKYIGTGVSYLNSTQDGFYMEGKLITQR
jgi:hypothetical protein